MKDRLFHVHTRRCGHAGNETDEEYIKTALQCHYKEIYFTDHAPFPGNPFGGRMKVEELNQYISDLQYLKDKYAEKIAVHIGLEIEWFLEYKSYYEALKEMPIDTLLLGQHMAKTDSNLYTYNMEQRSEEYQYLADAVMEGIESGYFDAVAHPDRVFMRSLKWIKEYDAISTGIINTAAYNHVMIERNYNSMLHNPYYYNFWENIKNKDISQGYILIDGADAHSTWEIFDFNKSVVSYKGYQI